uniref:Uncharacterized protein n=1 Tax=Triticum urartu TaxID=4572 RepID=A0A8R7P7A1_TRIUA
MAESCSSMNPGCLTTTFTETTKSCRNTEHMCMPCSLSESHTIRVCTSHLSSVLWNPYIVLLLINGNKDSSLQFFFVLFTFQSIQISWNAEYSASSRYS